MYSIFLTSSNRHSLSQQTVFATPVSWLLPHTWKAPTLIGKYILVSIDRWDTTSRYPKGHFMSREGRRIRKFAAGVWGPVSAVRESDLGLLVDWGRGLGRSSKGCPQTIESGGNVSRVDTVSILPSRVTYDVLFSSDCQDIEDVLYSTTTLKVASMLLRTYKNTAWVGTVVNIPHPILLFCFYFSKARSAWKFRLFD